MIDILSIVHCILDNHLYFIPDRGNDNWLISYECPQINTRNEEGNWNVILQPKIKIAAIDNGLAFPYKHPDEWRAYPFYWVWLPMARVPFSNEIKDLVLSKLLDPIFIESICQKLLELFKIDKDFKKSTFRDQMSVMRGQIFNLTTALQRNLSPYDLVNMPVVTIRKGSSKREITDDEDYDAYYPKRPFFSWC